MVKQNQSSDNTCMGMKSGSSEGLVPPATLISLIVHSKNDIKDRFCIENNWNLKNIHVYYL
jgi:hypothetical protein